MNEKTAGREGKHIKSAHTVFDIIEFIKENDGATASELTDELDYSKSTIHYYLKTLEYRRYIVEEHGMYYLGLRFFDLGNCSIARRDPHSAVKDEINTLAEKTGHAAYFAVEEGGKGMYVYQTDPEVLLNGRNRGIEHHLHSTASGKAILAHLPESEASNIIEQHGLPSITDETVTELDVLQSELEHVREYNIAFEHEERLPEIGAIAAPIINESGDITGAVGIAGDADELQRPVQNLENKSWKAQRFANKPWNIVRQTAQSITNKIHRG